MGDLYIISMYQSNITSICIGKRRTIFLEPKIMCSIRIFKFTLHKFLINSTAKTPFLPLYKISLQFCNPNGTASIANQQDLNVCMQFLVFLKYIPEIIRSVMLYLKFNCDNGKIKNIKTITIIDL